MRRIRISSWDLINVLETRGVMKPKDLLEVNKAGPRKLSELYLEA